MIVLEVLSADTWRRQSKSHNQMFSMLTLIYVDLLNPIQARGALKTLPQRFLSITLGALGVIL